MSKPPIILKNNGWRIFGNRMKIFKGDHEHAVWYWHREDGPAVETTNNQEYWLDDVKVENLNAKTILH